MCNIHCGFFIFFLRTRQPTRSTRTDTLLPYTTRFRSPDQATHTYHPIIPNAQPKASCIEGLPAAPPSIICIRVTQIKQRTPTTRSSRVRSRRLRVSRDPSAREAGYQEAFKLIPRSNLTIHANNCQKNDKQRQRKEK